VFEEEWPTTIGSIAYNIIVHGDAKFNSQISHQDPPIRKIDWSLYIGSMLMIGPPWVIQLGLLWVLWHREVPEHRIASKSAVASAVAALVVMFLGFTNRNTLHCAWLVAQVQATRAQKCLLVCMPLLELILVCAVLATGIHVVVFSEDTGSVVMNALAVAFITSIDEWWFGLVSSFGRLPQKYIPLKLLIHIDEIPLTEVLQQCEEKGSPEFKRSLVICIATQYFPIIPVIASFISSYLLTLAEKSFAVLIFVMVAIPYLNMLHCAVNLHVKDNAHYEAITAAPGLVEDSVTGL